MAPHLLNLPTELLERILSLLCHENAQSIQACRQACRKLKTIIAQSTLVQYLERVALLGMYDPLFLGGAASDSATLALPDRVEALRSWEESWNALAGGNDGDAGVFWQVRAPDLRIVLPPSRTLSPSSSARVRYMEATIIDPDPPVIPEDGENRRYYGIGLLSFGPWFISVTHDGIGVSASYSYLDLHGCSERAGGVMEGEREGVLGRIQSDAKEKETGDGDADYDRVRWTCIQVPVSNVVAFALSTELDLAVVISYVFSILTSILSSLKFSFLFRDEKKKI
jgi:hypothetical protein